MLYYFKHEITGNKLDSKMANRLYNFEISFSVWDTEPQSFLIGDYSKRNSDPLHVQSKSEEKESDPDSRGSKGQDGHRVRG